MSVLLLFSLALILNVNTSAAASTNATLKVSSVDPANNAIIQDSQSIKVKYSTTVKSGNLWVVLKKGTGKSVTVNTEVKGNTLTINPKQALSTGKYSLTIHSGAVKDVDGTSSKLLKTSFTVSPLTLAQMKDGINRAEKFYANNGRLPNTISYGSNKYTISEFNQIISTQGLSIKKPKVVSKAAAVAEVMKNASKYRYSSAAHTGKDMERIGSGDCWAMSDYLYTHLTAKGVKSRIIQYSTAYSSNHRSVQYYSNNKWVDVPYRTYFSTNMFNNTQSYGTVIRG